MQFEEREFLPVILGADITAYSLARSFHEEYRIKSLVLSMSEGGYIAAFVHIGFRVVQPQFLENLVEFIFEHNFIEQFFVDIRHNVIGL